MTNLASVSEPSGSLDSHRDDLPFGGEVRIESEDDAR
jgi:hypothetical protein